ncbi:MAG: calcium-binding protein [Rubrobacteraceae bacterium]|jgi:Ca2+-binding RTX toxin-like protein
MRGMRRMGLFLPVMIVAIVLMSGTALAVSIIEGTAGDDNLEGTRFSDRMIGKNGDDDIRGRGGRDEMRGDRGQDTMHGGGRPDTMHGGYEPDRMFGGTGRDYIEGGNGNDTIRIADGVKDSIDCGLGRDTAIVDDADIAQATVEEFFRLSSCENVIVR